MFHALWASSRGSVRVAPGLMPMSSLSSERLPGASATCFYVML